MVENEKDEKETVDETEEEREQGEEEEIDGEEESSDKERKEVGGCVILQTPYHWEGGDDKPKMI